MQEGLGFVSHLSGLFGQRLYFGHKTKDYSDKLKIDAGKCVGCGKCIELCPMKNLHLAQAVTLLGKAVVEQGEIGKYL